MTTDQPVIDASARRGREDRRPTVRILGTHGVPANYGGFETAAEKVGLHLLARGWRVVIYCQVEGRGPITYDEWQGIERVNVPVDLPGWRGTSLFDLKCVRHAGRYRDLNLVFGYNTGIFNIWQRLKRIPMVINMDGIEWSRSRWGFTRQAILYINERFSALFGNHLIADHPEIEKYLWTRAPKRKVTMIAYGADEVLDADDGPVRALGLEPGGYLTLICRPIPENSILELVEGFSRRPRGIKLALLGNYRPAEDEYHRAVVDAASDEVVALLSSVIAIWLLAKVLMAKDSLWELAALGGVFIVVVMTGSRTGIAALGAAGAAMILRMTALRMRSVSIIVLSFPPLTYLLLGTTLIASVFTRGGSEDLSNLSNRTIAWEAAGDMDRDGWQRWFGQGLAQKEISVPGQWWDTQMLDSTWVSALVQGGYLGLATVVLLMLLALTHALFAPRAVGAAWFGLLVYLALGGFLESGLFDGTVQFLVFLVAALGAFDGYHQRPRTVDPAGRPMAEATSDGSGSAMLAC
jgi:hypothetical protein